MSEPAIRHVITVREFTSGMARWFGSKSWLNDIAIAGEVSEVRSIASGQTFFKLKDGLAILECVLFPDTRRAMPIVTNGSAVIATGRIGIRDERSGYQLIVESVEATGIGVLFAQCEALKTQFRAEGLFDAARKRAVPALMRRVALISARAKAADDFEATIESKVPFVDVQFIETRVQGVGAEHEIAKAIAVASRLDVDAIVLTRGGGSYEDLFPFNVEIVVRAIAAARHPVLTAIGHESDHHLADDVADMQFGTPSKAAEYIAFGWLSAIERLSGLLRDIERAGKFVVGRSAQALQSVLDAAYRAAERVLHVKRAALRVRVEVLERINPQRVLAGQSTRIVVLNARLDAAMRRILGEALGFRLERARSALDRLDPQAPLQRGYAIVTKAGRAVTSAFELGAGDLLDARFGRGTASVRVEAIHPNV